MCGADDCMANIESACDGQGKCCSPGGENCCTLKGPASPLQCLDRAATVAAVKDYFARFTARWPTVAALGSASLDDVLRMWAGLGYYSRARNLHACAVTVLREHGVTRVSMGVQSVLPSSQKILREAERQPVNDEFTPLMKRCLDRKKRIYKKKSSSKNLCRKLRREFERWRNPSLMILSENCSSSLKKLSFKRSKNMIDE